ncbi:DNA-binding protein [Bacteroidia bacterium]|uniref:Helix-turn-helix domain-containing protein n=1 Tax=Dysgonomonas termitidis TaxID=1516126 RepID=A0ABV9KT50_9BACT|nr:DNA-binding protein [Bacteroidia bacterium]GHU78214.1 DNA-binding protein [Bacteroidia bacterium]GHV16166.1 DNA-binding protein [Bacteroidia bacterium]GHV48267.1 DNA-binding protein [Bacteroidia bacterium]
MEIVMVEARTYEAMMSRFEAFARKVEVLCERHQDKALKQWLDNQDVCIILNISPRTLQTYRDNGTLPYSQVNHKMYYRPEDVQAALRLIEEKRPKLGRKEAPYGR